MKYEFLKENKDILRNMVLIYKENKDSVGIGMVPFVSIKTCLSNIENEIIQMEENKDREYRKLTNLLIMVVILSSITISLLLYLLFKV